MSAGLLFRNISKKAKIALAIETAVAIIILIGGIFVLATETNAPTASVSPAPEFSTYISSILQISLKYPYGWQIDPNYNGIPGIERYQGTDGLPAGKAGFFQVDATNDPTPRAGRLIKKYPQPIKIGETTYRYFVLIADKEHLKSIGDSVEFMNSR